MRVGRQKDGFPWIHNDTNECAQEKKGDFLRFLKVAGTIFMTTVSKKNGKKK